MPVYNWRDRNVPTPPPAKFFDAASGEEVRYVFYWDSDTNHVGRFQAGPDGQPLLQGAATLETWEFRKLRIEWEGVGDEQADSPFLVHARRASHLLAMQSAFGDSTATYTTTSPATTQPFDFDAMLQMMTQLEAQRKQTDAGMASALRDYIDRSGVPITVWADRLGVDVDELLGAMCRGEPISGRLYDAIRRVFCSPSRPVG